MTHPFKFAFKRALLGFVFFGFFLKTLCLGFEPAGIVAFVRDTCATVEFQNPTCDRIKEVAVVGDDQDCAFVINKVLLQPSDCFGVEVVSRFVKKQHIWRVEQQLAQGHAAAFTT